MSKFFSKKIKEQKKEANKAVLDNSPLTQDELEKLLADAAGEVKEVVQEVKVIQEVTPVVAPKAEAKVVTQIAHNVYFDSTKRKFMLVTIEYTTNMQTAKIVSVEPFADDVAVAIKKLADKFALKLMRHTEKV